MFEYNWFETGNMFQFDWSVIQLYGEFVKTLLLMNEFIIYDIIYIEGMEGGY